MTQESNSKADAGDSENGYVVFLAEVLSCGREGRSGGVGSQMLGDAFEAKKFAVRFLGFEDTV
jgi:hypothetical protein